MNLNPDTRALAAATAALGGGAPAAAAEGGAVKQAAAVKTFKMATEAQPRAALDLLTATMRGVGTRLNVNA